jgi:MFS family permease
MKRSARIESPRTIALVAALLFLGLSLGGATLVLAAQDWFGAGDLRALLLWSTIGATLIKGAVGALTTRSIHWGATLASAAHGVAGALFGVAWLKLVAWYLGPWIMAFSFPVGTIWFIAAVVAFVIAAILTHPDGWRPGVGALVVPIAFWFVTVRVVTAKPPDIVVTLKAGVSDEQRESVWSDVLGHPAGHGGHDLLPGIASVSAWGTKDRSGYRVGFEPGTRQKGRDDLVEEVKRSPLVDRVEDYDPQPHGTVDF